MNQFKDDPEFRKAEYLAAGNERRHKIIAIDATDLFKAIEFGNIKFNHDIPKGVKRMGCKYDFKTNQIMFLIEHESFEPHYDGMIPPIYRIKPEE